MEDSGENQGKGKILRVSRFRADFLPDTKALLLIYLLKRLALDSLCVKIILSAWRSPAGSLKVLCERAFSTINYCTLSHSPLRCRRLIESDGTRDNGMVDVVAVFSVRRGRNTCRIRPSCLGDGLD